jgi:hypothetical protein
MRIILLFLVSVLCGYSQIGVFPPPTVPAAANPNLSNLGTTAINNNLLFASDGTYTIGQVSTPFLRPLAVYVGSGGISAAGNINGNNFLTNSVGHFISALITPASSGAACTAGAQWADATFVYVCTATNTIKRIALTTF